MSVSLLFCGLALTVMTTRQNESDEEHTEAYIE